MKKLCIFLRYKWGKNQLEHNVAFNLINSFTYIM